MFPEVKRNVTIFAFGAFTKPKTTLKCAELEPRSQAVETTARVSVR